VVDEVSITVPARLEAVRTLAEWVCGEARRAGLTSDGVIDLELALVEVANNIVLHGYGEDDGSIRCILEPSEHALHVTLIDWGRELPEANLSAAPLPDPGQDHGRGLGIARACVDELRYSTDNAINRLTLVKKLAG
jgi:serine/threonine-protein kinase RsbW